MNPIIAAKLEAAPRITMHESHRAHFYEVEGHPNPGHKKGWWPSVTSVLSAGTPKPALAGWARKDALESVRAVLRDRMPVTQDVRSWGEWRAWADSVVEAAGKREDTGARDYGTAAHDLITFWVYTGFEPEPGELGRESYLAFRSWLDHSGLTVEASEIPVFVAFGRDAIAGTVDLLLHDGSGYLIADIKTGNGIYAEHTFQLAAYARAASAMLGIGIREGIVIHLPKTPKDGEPPFAAHRVKDMAVAYVGYAAASAMRGALAFKNLEPMTVPEIKAGSHADIS